MDLTVFRKNCIIAVAEQSAAGHIDIIKGAVTGQNTVRKKGEFLHFSLIAFHSNMLTGHTKGCSITSSRSALYGYICF